MHRLKKTRLVSLQAKTQQNGFSNNKLTYWPIFSYTCFFLYNFILAQDGWKPWIRQDYAANGWTPLPLLLFIQIYFAWVHTKSSWQCGYILKQGPDTERKLNCFEANVGIAYGGTKKQDNFTKDHSKLRVRLCFTIAPSKRSLLLRPNQLELC